MKFLRDNLDMQYKELFGPGKPLEKLYPIYEANDTLLFTPGEVTKGNTHVRDSLDLKRLMITVVIALLPCLLMAFYNTGYQANLAIDAGHAAPTAGPRSPAGYWKGFRCRKSPRSPWRDGPAVESRSARRVWPDRG